MTIVDNAPLQACGTIIHVLQRHAALQPAALAYHFIEQPETGEGPRLDYAALDERARRIAAFLQERAVRDDRILLFFPPGIDYIATFLGCLYAGVVAVPLYPPRKGEKLDRIAHVIADCGARFALGLQRDVDRVGAFLGADADGAAARGFEFVAIDAAEQRSPMARAAYDRGPADLAFLQYTSGSTGDPKGVMVSHGNLMANQAAIAEGFGSRTDDVCLNWLPLYHDMGLIGATLHPLYCGYPSHIMSPMDFVKDPLSWLENISRFRATVAGGPDFGYRLCAKAAVANPQRAGALALSGWRLAFDGAEPIHAPSLRGFAKCFAPAGFDARAFYPCYGLAEATLFVTGSRPAHGATVWRADRQSLEEGRLEASDEDGGQAVVSCGHVASGHDLRIVADEREQPAGHVGEVWVSGPSIAAGYWGRGDANLALFQARIEGDDSGRRYLRTGDLGCLRDGQLVVTGRAKDVIIVGGRNYYPQDLELVAGTCCPAVRPGCTAAFSVDDDNGARVVIVQEVEPRHLRGLDVPATTQAIRAAVTAALQVEVDEVVLIQPATIPKTSSGKIRRRETRARFLGGTLEVAGQAAVSAGARAPVEAAPAMQLFQAGVLAAMPAATLPVYIESVLRSAIATATRQAVDAVRADVALTSLGLGSIAIMQLQNAIERDLGVRLDTQALLQGMTPSGLAQVAADACLARTTAPSAPAPAPERVRECGLSHQQQQLWFMHQLDPQRTDYNLPLLLESAQPIERGVFFAAVEDAVRRHAILRTTYRATDGASLQVVRDAPAFEAEAIDARGLDDAALLERLRALAVRPFDLEAGPVLRVAHAMRDDGRCWLLLCVHHIASDFWSMAMLTEEIFQHCAGTQPTSPQGDYRDWCAAQERYLRSPEAQRDLDWWRGVLAQPVSSGLEALSAASGDGRERRAGRVNFRLSASLLAKARQFAKAQGRTLNAVLLATYQLLLHRHTRLQRLSVGTLTAGRGDWRHETTQGYFVNPVALVTEVQPQDSFLTFLDRSATQLAEALAHQAYPFALLASACGSDRTRRHPLFQASFVMQQSQREGDMAGFAIKGVHSRIELCGQQLTSVPLDATGTPFDLALTVADTSAGLQAMLEYGHGVLGAPQARALADEFIHLLEAVLTAPERPRNRAASVVEAARDADGAVEAGVEAPAAEPADMSDIRHLVRHRAPREAATVASPAAAVPALVAAPRTEAEKTWVRLFAEVLDKPVVNVDDGFFELGGDSIRIIQLRSRALKAGLAVSVQDIFRLQTPAALAAIARTATVAMAAERPRLAPFALVTEAERRRMPAGVVDAYPLARLQEGLLFHSLYGDDIAMYCDIFEFRLNAPFDRAAFEQAVARLVDRHPIFRTSFQFADFDRPLQLVHRSAPARIDVFDHRASAPADRDALYQGWIEEEKRKPYDVAQAPLLRFSLHRLTDDEFVFTMSFHDALLDGWSESSTVSELLADYFHLLEGGAPPVGAPVRTQFSDFVAIEHETIADPRVHEFWMTELEDMRPTRLPRWGDPEGRAHRVKFHAVDIPPALSDQLKAVAARLGVSLKHVLLAAHAAVVGYLCGESDVVLAVESNGRLEDGDGEKVLGTHLNVVPWRLQMTDESWESLIRRVHDKEATLQPYRRFPYQAIQGMKGNEALFDISFNYTHFHVYESLEQIERLGIVDAKAYIHTHFAMRVEFNQDPFTRHLTLDIEANVEAVPVPQIRLAGECFRRALESIAAEPASNMTHTRLLTDTRLAEEQSQDSGPVTVDAIETLELWMTRFDRCARENAQCVAAVDAQRELRYGELAAASRRVAADLQRRGVQHGDVVALLADRSIDYLTVLIACLRLGAAFVPLPDGPVDRINQIVARAGVAHLVHARDRHALEPGVVDCVRRIALEALVQAADAPDFADTPLHAGDLAYMIFTSGSTGEPKGVMIEHGGMINHMQAKIADLGIAADGIVSQDAAATFDICVWQFLAPLLAGARVRIFEDDIAKDPARLLERVIAEKVTVLEVSPSVLSTMLVIHGMQAGPVPGSLSGSALRWVVSSGEALQPSLVQQLRVAHPQVGILNMWGATETSDDCTHYAVPPGEHATLERVSIGRPIMNSAVYVLDPWRRPVPAGTPGELYVGGLCVGRGYVNDPQRSAAAYLENDREFATSRRLYRTGDRGYRGADGLLYFIGRRDHQVKIRGHRIEIGEVEAALNRQSPVQEAAVRALPDADGQLFLAAWIVPSEGTVQDAALFVASLRTLLKKQLPAYMVPDVMVTLADLPRNVNGKVDRKALAVPAGVHEAGTGPVVAPDGPTEAFVHDLFCQVLKRASVSTDAHFFEVGGNSLLATQVVSRVRRHFDRMLPIRALFEHDTIARFSRHIDRLGGDAAAVRRDEAIPVQRRPERVPLSFNQERLWFLDQIDESQRAYGCHFALRVHGALDADALEAALQAMVDRHETLRTRFEAIDGQPFQLIADRMSLPLARVDLQGVPAAERPAALGRAMNDEVRRPFRLDQLPLCAATLYRVAPDEHVLLWRNHHIVGDGWSAGVMLREIERLYRARTTGGAPDLKPLAIQFADYATWQRAQEHTPAFAQRLAFWDGYLAGHSGVLQLPTDFERPERQTFEGRRLPVRLDAALTARLRGLCGQARSTLFALLQCSLGLLLSRYAKQGDLLMGTAIANRQRVETEPLIGFLTNTLPVRLRFDPASSFADHLARTRDDLLDVFENQDVPFAHLVNRTTKTRHAGISPLVQVMMVLQNADASMPEIDGLRIEPVELDRAAAILDLVFDLREADGGVTGNLEYNAALFEERTMRSLWQHFQQLLESVLEAPHRPLAELSTLAPLERRALQDAWRALQPGRSGIEFWSELAPQAPHWDRYLEAAEEQGLLMSAYMAVSEYS